jgi:hypothetical protein
MKLLRVITPREILSQYMVVPSPGEDETVHDINTTIPQSWPWKRISFHIRHSPPPRALREPVPRGMV